MLGLIAGLAAVVTSVPAARDLLPAANWWEKITVTIAGDGKPQGCRFESSLASTSAKDCDIVGAPTASSRVHTVSSHDQYESITFERRFSAGAAPPLDAALQVTADALRLDGFDRTRVEHADALGDVRSQRASQLHGSRPALLQRSIIQVSVRIAVQDLMREH